MKRRSLLTLTLLLGCGQQRSSQPEQVAAQPALHTDSAAGEVAQFALMRDAVRWLTDSNVVSLSSVVNESAVRLARAESEAWTDEQVHAFALAVLRDHEALQTSLDSLASRRRIPAQSPAVAQGFRAPYDSIEATLVGLPAAKLDRAFLTAATNRADHARLDFAALAANATDPDLKALLANRAAVLEQQHLIRARQLAASLAIADSAKLAGKRDHSP